MPRKASDDRSSVIALKTLMTEALSDRTVISSDLALALRSQGALAKFRDDSRHIVPMSLNHQKAVATSVFGSYFAVDELRRALLGPPAKPVSSDTRRSRNKAGLQELAQEQAREIQLLKEDLVLLQRAFDLRCRQAREYAEKAGEPVISRCAKELREVEAGLSLLRHGANAPNVTPIGSSKR